MSQEPERLSGRRFRDRSLRGSRFAACDLGDVVIRGIDVAGMEIDSPWLLEGGSTLVVNGVDVVPLVDAELDRRFPGRALRGASDVAGLRAAWDAVERAWAATLERARALPEGTVDASVDDEWSLAQTWRHLVLATDLWLGRAVLGREQPFHPLGLRDDSDSPAFASAAFTPGRPPFEEVLAARADRQAMVRGFLAHADAAQLAEPRRNPHASAEEADQDPETVLSCLHTILEEEWEHHRYAVRDLDQLAARDRAPRP